MHYRASDDDRNPWMSAKQLLFRDDARNKVRCGTGPCCEGPCIASLPNEIGAIEAAPAGESGQRHASPIAVIQDS